MGQNEILSSLQLFLFKDKRLIELMNLLADTKIAQWRDKFCIANYNASEIIDNTIPCRLVLSWIKSTPVSNGETSLRTLSIDIFVQKDIVYNADNNAFSRRQDLIQNHLKQLINSKRIEGFRFWCCGIGDSLSGNIEFSKAFILFEVKYIF